jgi:hypothetical protein
MLQQTSDHDAIEQVRSDPAVREVIDWYRSIDPEQMERHNLYSRFWYKTHFGKNARGFSKEELAIFSALGEDLSQIQADAKRSFEQRALSIVINRIAKAYTDITGESSRTMETNKGKNPFWPLTIKLFTQEGLKPPSIYAIRQALKKTKGAPRSRDRT